MRLFHYFEKSRGPFLAITELPQEEAMNILSEIARENPNLVHPNPEWFLTKRRELETIVRDKFIEKGGKPVRIAPHYMTVEKADCMNSWYNEPECIEIDVKEFDLSVISFTYGDTFPIFNNLLDNGEEYRNNVYRYDEIINIINKYGYPQETEHIQNVPMNYLLKYAEAHIWSDDVVKKHREKWLNAHCHE